MERVSELQMQKCMKRRELSAGWYDGGGATEQPQREDYAASRKRGEEPQQRAPWPEKRPFGWPRPHADDCGGDATMRALRSYCRDRNLPDDMYRPVRAGQCGGDGTFRLADLVDELHRVFAEDRVNVEYVQYLMKSYRSDPAEWLKYAKFNKFRYTRNLVDAGNDKFNLMVLCWGEGHGSSIHDHPNSECVMKILAGQLNEVRFAWPERRTSTTCPHDGDDVDANDDDGMQPMCETSRTVLPTDGICHINDTMGLHRVENVSYTDKAVSLHLYCPPFEECSTFNQQTGHETKAKSTFWSIYGEKVSKKRAEEHVPDDN